MGSAIGSHRQLPHPYIHSSTPLSEPRLMLIEIKKRCTVIDHIREIELGQE